MYGEFVVWPFIIHGISMEDLKVVIQYPSFGPQHPPRLEAIASLKPTPGSQVVAMEMFKRDSDYEWLPIEHVNDTSFIRYTVMDCNSETARRSNSFIRKSVYAALDDIAPDILVINGWGLKESRASIKWCRKNSCKVVLLSDSVRENRKRFWLLELYKKWIVRGIKAGFVAGTPQASYLEYLGVPREGIFAPGTCVVDNTYWIEQSKIIRQSANKIRKAYGLPEHYFLCVARFVNFKNIPFLIKSYALYRKHAGKDAIDLVICGSGVEETKIRSTIKEYNLTSVHLHGFRQIDELPAFYSLASCFILPSSNFECWGFVVNEAMASGLPVLVSNMVGSAEDLVKNGENGFVFDPHDEFALARFMREITSNEDIAQKMGCMSLEIIAGHTPLVAADMFWRAVNAAQKIE